MPAAIDVHPAKWEDIRVLFDDGRYSLISGTYFHDGKGRGNSGVRRIASRWNGDGDQWLGFPIASGHPVWHVEPEMLTMPILRGLIVLIALDSTQGQYRQNVESAIREFAHLEAVG